MRRKTAPLATPLLRLPAWALLSLGAATILLVSFLYVTTETEDPVQHSAMISALRELRELDVTINQDVLRARQDLLQDYDAFVSSMRQLKEVASIYRRTPFIEELAEADQGLLIQFRELEELVLEKEIMLERFKSDHAVFKNSLRYIPQASDELTRRLRRNGLTDVADELEGLTQGMLVYANIPDTDIGIEVVGKMADLKEILPDLRAALAQDLSQVLRHLEITLFYKSRIDDTLPRLLSMPVAERASALEKSYETIYQRSVMRSNLSRSFLYFFSMLLLLYLGYLLYRLRSGSLMLLYANKNLRNEVRERQEAEHKLKLYKQIFDNASDAVLVLDNQLTIVEQNIASKTLLKYPDETLAGAAPSRVLGEDAARAMREELEGTGLFRHELVVFPYDNGGVEAEVSAFAVYDANQEVLCYVCAMRDITERASHISELEYQALHDALTGLPNRAYLYRKLMDVIEGDDDRAGIAALMLMDLDHFKEINDTLGHYAGDMVLKQVGQRLMLAVDAHGTVARLGGDEFAILMDCIPDTATARERARDIVQLLKRPFELDGLKLEIGGSVGVSIYPRDGPDAKELMRCADVAMYIAKQNAIGVAIYDAQVDRHSPQRLALMTELGKAMREHQLKLYYQPKVSLIDGSVIGVEALVRWEHPMMGLVLPAQFVPLAETGELIHALTFWVVEEALAQCRRWRKQGLSVPVAVNISARNLLKEDLLSQLTVLLEVQDAPAGCLELELTESAIMSDPVRSAGLLRRIHDVGIALAIDDFGTGHSSLAYLSRLPIDTLKIDQSFVSRMKDSPEDAVIVRSIIDLAHTLNLAVVAEGVEDHETLEELRRLGCNAIQGFLIAQPMPAEQAGAWLAGRHIGPGRLFFRKPVTS